MSDRPKEKERNRASDRVKVSGGGPTEGDPNNRSSKKHKESHSPPGDETSPSADAIPVDSIPVDGRHVGISYKASLVGELLEAYEQAFFGVAMEADDVSSDEEEDVPELGEVIIRFPRELKCRIKAPWSTSLIVKVFGRTVRYIFLINKLKALWKSAGDFSCVDLGSSFFLVKFESKNDFEEVLRGGPWFIGEHFLSIRPWSLNFRASEASMSSMAVWVRLLELPVEYYLRESLLRIGNGLGPVLRVDFNTASGSRGRFAQLCIQVDLDKPLVKTVRVGSVWVAVIYEGIGCLCFQCGRVGHHLDCYPDNCPAGSGPTPTKQASTSVSEEGKDKPFGTWMLVSRRKQQSKSAKSSLSSPC